MSVNDLSIPVVVRPILSAFAPSNPAANLGTVAVGGVTNELTYAPGTASTGMASFFQVGNNTFTYLAVGILLFIIIKK